MRATTPSSQTAGPSKTTSESPPSPAHTVQKMCEGSGPRASRHARRENLPRRHRRPDDRTSSAATSCDENVASPPSRRHLGRFRSFCARPGGDFRANVYVASPPWRRHVGRFRQFSARPGGDGLLDGSVFQRPPWRRYWGSFRIPAPALEATFGPLHLDRYSPKAGKTCSGP